MRLSTFLALATSISGTFAATSYVSSTNMETVTTCASTVTDCPARNGTNPIPEYSDAAAQINVHAYGAGAVAFALCAMLL